MMENGKWKDKKKIKEFEIPNKILIKTYMRIK